MKKWRGYFTCPVCGKENEIPGWNIEEGKKVEIKFTAKNKEDRNSLLEYASMMFTCEYCGATWKLGIKPQKE